MACAVPRVSHAPPHAHPQLGCANTCALPLPASALRLALKCQRARNLGYDIPPGAPKLPERGWEMLMEEMAECKFEGDGGMEKLAEAIRLRLPEMSRYPDAEPPVMISVALKSLGFVERGL